MSIDKTKQTRPRQKRSDVIPEKPWYMSKGVWGSLGAIVAQATLLASSIAGIYTGHVVADEAHLGIQIGALITSSVGLWGRVVATTRIRI